MITAIILAAGESKRMGQAKMLLRWGESTVLQTIIATYRAAGLDEILVVTGAGRERVETLIGNSAQTIYNEKYALGEMLSSVQTGLSVQKKETEAVLIALGDQPHLDPQALTQIVGEYLLTRAVLIVPSFQLHRGHPWLVRRDYWEEILAMRPPETLGDFLNRHSSRIHYVAVNTPSVLQDLDTPDDYLNSGPSIAVAN